MRKENKELLLKDLCARVPYGVKVNVAPVPQEEYKYQSFNAKVVWVGVNHTGVLSDKGFFFQQDVIEIRPYLYPLSSMTEEQLLELSSISFENSIDSSIKTLNWCYKNHFDVNNLIPMGLAIDCTNLYVY